MTSKRGRSRTKARARGAESPRPPEERPARRGRSRAWLLVPLALLLAAGAFFLHPWRREAAPGRAAGSAVPAGPVTEVATLPPGTPVLFITIDTLREDHVSRSGYHRETTPCLDSLAAEGIYFANCFSQCSWTLPSMLSLISSLSPPVFGIHDGVAPIPKADEQPQPESPRMKLEVFAEAHVTLAEVLRDHGYETVGVTTNGHLIDRQGFPQGFASYDETHCMWGTADCALQRTLEEIESRRPDSLFVWVHLFDPHFDKYGSPPTYTPAPGYEKLFGDDAARSQAAAAAAAYDRKIRFTDDQLRAFFDALERDGLFDRFLIVVAADHGEEFNEKGRWGHSKSVTNTLLHVPLIFRLPRGEAGGRVVPGLVRNLDVVPTILDLLGMPSPAAAEGVSLRPAIEGRTPPAPAVYAETRRMGLNLMCLIDPTIDRKVVVDLRTGAVELYAFSRDPGEGLNLAGRHPGEARQLAQRLQGLAQQLAERAILESAPGTISDEERERLRSLGYLGGG